MDEKICRRPRLLPQRHCRLRDRIRMVKKRRMRRAKKILTTKRKVKTMKADKARRLWISHECRGVSPRRRNARHTSPRFPTFATSGIPESRASKVVRRRVLSVFIFDGGLPA